MSFELPMPNATLTKVFPGGSAEDYERVGTQGAEKWSGSAGIYFTEVSEQQSDGQSTSRVIARSVLAPADLPVEFENGDTIRFTRSAATINEQVVRVQRTEFPGAPGVVRLHLEDG